VSEWSLSTLPSPIPELQHAPLPLKVLWARERASTPPFSIAFYLGSHLSHLKSWECVIHSKYMPSSSLCDRFLIYTFKQVSDQFFGYWIYVSHQWHMSFTHESYEFIHDEWYYLPQEDFCFLITNKNVRHKHMIRTNMIWQGTKTNKTWNKPNTLKNTMEHNLNVTMKFKYLIITWKTRKRLSCASTCVENIGLYHMYLYHLKFWKEDLWKLFASHS